MGILLWGGWVIVFCCCFYLFFCFVGGDLFVCWGAFCYCIVWYCTVQYSTILYSTLQYTIQYSHPTPTVGGVEEKEKEVKEKLSI